MAGFDFKKTEDDVLHFWDSQHIFEKSLELRAQKRKKNFVFFEGPPTANGHPHMGHFEGRLFKDLFNRYKTMRGFYVLRKAGWDTHGLPVEIGIEKELGFKSKKDIEEYGIASFNQKAKESVWEYTKEWEEMTKRMGFWVDLQHPYVTYETPYIESIWAVIKKIWDKKLIYQAHKVIPFCTRCGTPLSSHEVAQGYKKVTDRTAYVKFKLKDSKFGDNASILAWTTTPWTLPGNVALAVGPEIQYIAAKYGGATYILAKELAPKVLGESFETIHEMKGSELAGLAYEPLFDIEALKSDRSYTVYPAGFVSTTDGTGIVHIAPMYGEDDYALGMTHDLPKVHTVNEQGKFVGVSDALNDRFAKRKETEDIIIAHLEKEGTLLKTEDYEHDYPECWRCHTLLLYYAKTSWFIRMSAVNDQLVKNNQKINWVPAHLKEGRFGQWIKEGKDWAISRERYWGTPLPIWKCVKCGEAKALGAIADLRKQSLSSGNTYYVMRHGHSTRKEQTDMIINSRRETDTYHLTPEGEKQARKNIERLAISEQIDEIYASPFLRTQETAQVAGKFFHHEIQTDDRLGEMRHGEACEGKGHNVCITYGRTNAFHQTDDHDESYDDVRTRLESFMSEMETTYRNKKILIVSHGDPLWLLEKMSRGMTEQEVKAQQNTKTDWYPAPAEIKKVTWEAIPRNEVGELDLHRPFIDDITVSCDSCSATMRRIPDLADVWFDSGCMPYAQWHWPFENDKMFNQQFPADFIAEGVDQTRGWFYTLLAIATLLDKGAPYKNVMSLGHVLDEKGQKLAKSAGNYVSPHDIMDKVGVDAVRWYFYTVNDPGDEKAFRLKDVEERLKGFLTTLQNCMRFYELYASQAGGLPALAGEVVSSSLLDDWVLSKFNGLVLDVSTALDAYNPMPAARAIERFVVDDFSNWWLRRSRKRTEALPLLRHLLIEIAKLSAPFIPFTAEDMFKRLNAQAETQRESVHLTDWSIPKKKLINKKLEDKMTLVQDAITKGLALRKESQIKVRQPLAAIVIMGKKFDADLEDLIKDELNVKEVRYQKSGEVHFDTTMTPELLGEGYAREVMRQIQDMRKEAGYRFDEPVYCQWHTEDSELMHAAIHWTDTIKKDTVLSEFINLKQDGRAFNLDKEFDIAPGKKIWLGVKK